MTKQGPVSRADVSVAYIAAPYDEALIARTTALLSPAEAARYARFHSSADRDMFAAAHGLLRAVIATRAGVPITAVVVTQRCQVCGGNHGQPVIPQRAPGAGLMLSLAHTRSMVVVAWSDRPVGVDVEDLDRQVTMADLSGALTVNERRAIGELAPASRTRELLRVWVCKEAYCKGLGLGLMQPFDEVELWAKAEGEAVMTIPVGHLDDRPWTVHDMQVEGHLIAVAYRGPVVTLAVFNGLHGTLAEPGT